MLSTRLLIGPVTHRLLLSDTLVLPVLTFVLCTSCGTLLGERYAEQPQHRYHTLSSHAV